MAATRPTPKSSSPAASRPADTARKTDKSLPTVVSELATLTIDFHREIRAGQLVLIKGAVTRVGGKSFTHEMRLYEADSMTHCATQKTVEVCFDTQARKGVALPEDVAEVDVNPLIVSAKGAVAFATSWLKSRKFGLVGSVASKNACISSRVGPSEMLSASSDSTTPGETRVTRTPVPSSSWRAASAIAVARSAADQGESHAYGCRVPERAQY